jgi:hypothetical protein
MLFNLNNVNLEAQFPGILIFMWKIGLYLITPFYSSQLEWNNP